MPVLVVPVLVVLALVLGLGGYFLVRESNEDPFADYCSEVEARRAEIGAALGEGEQTGLIQALPAFESLAAKAPEDIRDEWSIVVTRITALRTALADADILPADYDATAPPAGLDPADAAAIKAAAVGLGAEEMMLALAGVQQQARDVCKTPLSM